VAGGVDGHGGGIVGLVRLLNEHGEAIEYELLTIGRNLEHLGTRHLSWRDLKVVVNQAPPGGALHRSLDPKGWAWGADTYMLAGLVDLTAAANWQRAGDKHKKRPDPLPRPNEKKPKKKSLTQQVLEQRQKDREAADVT
jgi:hypothetical protein